MSLPHWRGQDWFIDPHLLYLPHLATIPPSLPNHVEGVDGIFLYPVHLCRLSIRTLGREGGPLDLH